MSETASEEVTAGFHRERDLVKIFEESFRVDCSPKEKGPRITDPSITSESFPK